MITFVGAGCGAADLITVRGMRLLTRADTIIYTGSLVNEELLGYAKDSCFCYDSSKMTLDEVMDVMIKGDEKQEEIVRLHTGDPSLYGAIQEQMHILDEHGIGYETCPGVSACFGAAASLNLEYTLPDISQSLIITRMAGRTAVPEKESIESFAKHGATMAIYLSSGMLEELQERLIAGGYSPSTMAAIVYKASWPDEKKFICTVGTLAKTGAENGINRFAVILVGDVIGKAGYSLSKLYDPYFETGYRKSYEK
jgi:precorrin-4/cobalt-precorrin-4 C11-methyltransferase